MTLLWAGFILGALFGAAARASGFCLLRGLRQALGLDDPTGHLPGTEAGAPALQAFVLALAVALAATQALLFTGALNHEGTAVQLLPARASFSLPGTLIGGLLFGAGMVLARGCGARALVLLAGGNLRALLVLLCLGLAAQATMTGVLAVLPQWLRNLGGLATPAHATLTAQIQALLPGNALAGWLLVAGLPVAILLTYALWQPALRRRPLHCAGAVVIGALVAAGWWVSNAWADPFDEQPASSLSFIGPVADSLLYLQLAVGRQPSFGAAIVAGVLTGAALTALAMRSARWEGFERPADMATSAAGGLLMGSGGVLAMGCSIGQGLSGLSTLAWASLPAAVGIVLGALGLLKVRQWLSRT